MTNAQHQESIRLNAENELTIISLKKSAHLPWVKIGVGETIASLENEWSADDKLSKRDILLDKGYCVSNSVPI